MCGCLKSPGTAWSQRLWGGSAGPGAEQVALYPAGFSPTKLLGVCLPHCGKKSSRESRTGPRAARWLSEPPQSAGRGRTQAAPVFPRSQAWALRKVGGILWLSPWGLHVGRGVRFREGGVPERQSRKLSLCGEAPEGELRGGAGVCADGAERRRIGTQSRLLVC